MRSFLQTIPSLLLLPALPVLLLSSQAVSEEGGRIVAPGIRWMGIVPEDGSWEARLLSVDVNSIDVRIDVEVASEPAGERVGQATGSLSHLGRRTPVAVVRYPDLDADDLPKGMVVGDRSLLTSPGKAPSLVATESGRLFISDFACFAAAYVSPSTGIPLTGLNCVPEAGEGSLFTPPFPPPTFLPGTKVLPLDRYSPYFDPFGATNFRVAGPIHMDPPEEKSALHDYRPAILKTRYHLVLPLPWFEAHREFLRPNDELRVYGILQSPNLHRKVLDSLGGRKGADHDPIRWAVSPGPRILFNGTPQLTNERGDSDRISVLGIDSTGGKLWIATFKARKDEGISLASIINRLLDAGLTDALLLPDQSSGLETLDHGLPRSRDSDSRNEPGDPRVQLTVSSLSGPPDIGEIFVEPGTAISVAPSATVEFSIGARDVYGNPLPIDPNFVSAEILRGKGRLEGLLYRAPQEPGETVVCLDAAKLQGARYRKSLFYVVVRVEKPDRISIDPKTLIANPGERVALSCRVFGRSGTPLLLNMETIRWRIDDELGAVSREGVFLPRSSGRGRLSAEVGPARAEVDVYVGGITEFPVPVADDFDEWSVEADREIIESRIVPSADGESTLDLGYFFGWKETGGIIYRRSIPLADKPFGFRMQVSGDGSENILEILIRDSRERLFALRFDDDALKETTRREAVLLLSDAKPLHRGRIRFPIRFEGFRVRRRSETSRARGRIRLSIPNVLYQRD